MGRLSLGEGLWAFLGRAMVLASIIHGGKDWSLAIKLMSICNKASGNIRSSWKVKPSTPGDDVALIPRIAVFQSWMSMSSMAGIRKWSGMASRSGCHPTSWGGSASAGSRNQNWDQYSVSCWETLSTSKVCRFCRMVTSAVSSDNGWSVTTCKAKGLMAQMTERVCSTCSGSAREKRSGLST